MDRTLSLRLESRNRLVFNGSDSANRNAMNDQTFACYPGEPASPAQILALASEYKLAASFLLHNSRPKVLQSRGPFRMLAIHSIELHLNAYLLRIGHAPTRSWWASAQSRRKSRLGHGSRAVPEETHLRVLRSSLGSNRREGGGPTDPGPCLDRRFLAVVARGARDFRAGDGERPTPLFKERGEKEERQRLSLPRRIVRAPFPSAAGGRWRR